MTTLKNASFLGVLEQTCETKEQKLNCLTHVLQSIDKDLQIELLINLMDNFQGLQRQRYDYYISNKLYLMHELLTVHGIYSIKLPNKLCLFTDNSTYQLSLVRELNKFVGKMIGNTEHTPKIFNSFDEIFRWIQTADQDRKQKFEEKEK